jgi:hypothetical protein
MVSNLGAALAFFAVGLHRFVGPGTRRVETTAS